MKIEKKTIFVCHRQNSILLQSLQTEVSPFLKCFRFDRAIPRNYKVPLIISNFRLGTCINFWDRIIFQILFARSVLGGPGFILYFNAEFPDPFYADFFVMLLTAVNGKQQICDQSGEYLDHKTILASGNQMVDTEVTFPPSKEYLYVPSKLVNMSNLLCC